MCVSCRDAIASKNLNFEYFKFSKKRATFAIKFSECNVTFVYGMPKRIETLCLILVTLYGGEAGEI